MSSRKQTTVFVSVVILLILILVLPFCDGILFKHKVESLVSKVGQRYHIKLVTYKRGWFTSDFKLSMQNQLFNKVETYHVTHGPLVIYQHTPEFALGKVTSNSTIKNIGTTNGSGVISLFGNVTIHSQLKFDDNLFYAADIIIASAQANTHLKVSPVEITAKISSKLDQIYEKLTIPSITVTSSDNSGINMQLKNISYAVNATRKSNNDWIADTSFGIESADMHGDNIKASLTNFQVENLSFDLNQAKRIMSKNLNYDEKQQQLLQTIIALPKIKLDKLSYTDPLNNFEVSGQVSWPALNAMPQTSAALLDAMDFNLNFKGASEYFDKLAKQKAGVRHDFYAMPTNLTSTSSHAYFDFGSKLIKQLLQQGQIKKAKGVYNLSISKNQQNIMLNGQSLKTLDAAYLSLILQVNLDTTLQQLQMLAQQNNLYAQYLLGYQYLYGLGVAKDQAKGLQWLEKSAAQANINAQELLANVYRFGLAGVPKDMAQATKWYEQGICYNTEFSAGNLALMYYFGVDEPADYAKAYKYMYILNRNKDESLSKYLKTAAEHMTKQQIQKAKALPSCLTNDIQPILINNKTGKVAMP